MLQHDIKISDGLGELNPFVRFADSITLFNSYQQDVASYDYRIFYVQKGSCTFFLKNEKYLLTPHALLLFPPAIPYRFVFEKGESISLDIVNFDLCCEHPEASVMTPDTQTNYDSSKKIPQPRLSPFCDCIFLTDSTESEPLLSGILQECSTKAPYYRTCVSGMMKQLLAELARTQHHPAVPLPKLVIKMADFLRQNACSCIKSQDLAHAMNYHPYYLNRLFSKHMGKTIHQFVLEERLKQAQHLLISTPLSIQEIASAVGFSSSAYFSKYFKDTIGQTPTVFREKHRVV